jgi:hypothetical protein
MLPSRNRLKGETLADDPRPQNWWHRLPETTKGVAAAVGGVTLVVASLTTLTEVGQKAFQKVREMVAPAAEIQTDYCGQLDGRTIYATTSNYAGFVGPEGLKLIKSADGGFSFETYFEFDKATNHTFGIDPDGPDKIHDLTRGDCHANRIKFTRSVRDGSAQNYNGTISLDPDGNLAVIGGTFKDQQKLKYDWSAWIGYPVR